MAQQSKHTPAPWRADERLSGSENHKGWRIMGATGVVGEVFPLGEDPTPAARANARLIAAAPALLNACAQFVYWYAEDSTEENRDNAYDAACKAIELTEG